MIEFELDGDVLRDPVSGSTFDPARGLRPPRVWGWLGLAVAIWLVAVVAAPYVIWLLVIGRHLLGQVQHLL